MRFLWLWYSLVSPPVGFLYRGTKLAAIIRNGPANNTEKPPGQLAKFPTIAVATTHLIPAATT
jgi:hypothetical protein